ncbi:IQ motif and ankyrin repeat domain-containing protein 1-like isoform X2 [Halichondria panicea]
MEKLQRDAYLQMVRLEQERAEVAYRHEEDERRRKREQAKRVKRMLEAAFDGDTTEIKALLSEVEALYMDSDEAVVARYQHKLVECTDPNNNTPLSEAAAGGDPDTIRLLMSLGADPNTKGQFGRTSLYRAAFGGHLEAVRALLESGANPRLLADDGATPEQVAANPTVEECLSSWEVESTDKLLASLEEQRSQRLERETKLRQKEESKIQDEITEAEKDNSSKQKQLAKAYEELNKRIFEHDTYSAEKGDITLPAVQDAEAHLEICKLHAEEARKKLQQIRLKLRMKKKEFQDLGDEEDDDVKVDVVINIRELDDVLLKDVGNKITNSDKWPLIIDSNQQAATFMRYRDTNYLNVCSPKNMETDTIRMALLGAIRYGKFAVIDLMDIDNIWRSVEQRFETVQKNLLAELMSKQLMKEEKYLSLVKKSDGPEYSPKMFQGARTQNFKFVLVTQLPHPPEELLQQCYTIRIHTPNM